MERRAFIRRSGRRLLGACLAGGLVFGAFLSARGARPSVKVPAPPSIHESIGAPTSTVIDTRPFLLGVPAFWTAPPPLAACPGGAGNILVLPHYLPVHARIRSVLAAWRACRGDVRVKRVIVIGPDHFHSLEAGAATYGGDAFATPLGDVPMDAGLVESLKRVGVPPQAELFSREHGVGLFPVFIREAFPQAAFVPLVVSGKATRAELAVLVPVLREALADRESLVIISADFSHYLPFDQAEARDRDTLRAFAAHDAGFFWPAHDDHTDNGRALWLASVLVDPAATFQVLDRVNSVALGGSRTNTTSFFFGWWGPSASD